MLRTKKGIKGPRKGVKTDEVQMFYRKASFWFTMLLLAIVLPFVLLSFGYSAQARLVPLLVGIPALALIMTALISERYPGLLTLFNIGFAEGASPATPGALAPSERVLRRRLLAASAWIAGFLILVFLVGFLVAVPVFTLLYLTISGRVNWLKTIVVSLIMGGVMYGGFEILMKADMFKGVLFGAIPPIF